MSSGSDTYLERVEVKIERDFAAPVDRVWQAFTQPELMTRWMWSGMDREVWAESDLRVGGAYRVYTRAKGGRHQGEDWSGMLGLFVEIVPEKKLVYTLHWDADVGYNQDGKLTLDEVVAVTLTPAGDSTHMEFVHMGIPDDVSATHHRAGIAETLETLASLVTG